jgi:hypothetical protein
MQQNSPEDKSVEFYDQRGSDSDEDSRRDTYAKGEIVTLFWHIHYFRRPRYCALLLRFILLNFIMNVFQGYPRFFKHGLRIRGIVVTPLADYPDYAAIDDEHSAGPAGGHPAVQGTARNGDSPFCRLAYRVLFRVNGSDAMGGNAPVLMNHFFKLVPRFVAVGKSGGRSYIAGYQDLVILGNDTPGSPPVTSCPFRDGVTDFHKIFIPARPDIRAFHHDGFFPYIYLAHIIIEYLE